MDDCWKIYLVNKKLLHIALRRIGCSRDWFYTDEFYRLIYKTYGNIENHFVIFYNHHYNGTDPNIKWDYDFDYVKIYNSKLKETIDYRRKVKLDRLNKL